MAGAVPGKAAGRTTPDPVLHSAVFSAANPQAMSEIGVLPFLVLLMAATVSSLVIAALYQFYFATTATGSQIYRAFPLLGLTVAALFVTVQFSLPLSLGLLGALSIVRFRTPVKEPEEIGILMVIIAVGVASATFKLQFLGILLAFTMLALALQRLARAGVRHDGEEGLVVLAMPPDADLSGTSRIRRAIDAHLGPGRLERVAVDSQNVTVSYRIDGESSPDVAGLRRELAGYGPAAVTLHLEARNER